MKKRILYVEDNPRNMVLIKRIMTADGYELLEATDGQMGWETAVREQPDLILMDLHLLGDLSGFELTHLLRQNPNFEQTPIIALTAYNSAEVETQARAAGCNDFLTKPANIQQIRTVVSHHLTTLNKPSATNGFVSAY